AVVRMSHDIERLRKTSLNQVIVVRKLCTLSRASVSWLEIYQTKHGFDWYPQHLITLMTSSFSSFVYPAVMLPRNNCRCDCTTLELLPQPLVFSSWIACHAIMTPHRPAICFRDEKGHLMKLLVCFQEE
ncbi:Matrix protein VP40, partial [Frankliniella fusca]